MSDTVREFLSTLGFSIGLVLPVIGGLLLIDHVFGIDPSATVLELAFGWMDFVVVSALTLFILFAMPYLPGKSGRF